MRRKELMHEQKTFAVLQETLDAADPQSLCSSIRGIRCMQVDPGS